MKLLLPHLSYLKDQIGDSSPTNEKSSVVKMTIAHALEVFIEEIPEDTLAHIYAPLTGTGFEPSSALMKALLEAQLFSQQVGHGQVFGFDSNSGELFLNLSLKLHSLQPEDFYEQVSEFVTWARYWKEQIADFKSSAESVNPDTHFDFVKA